MGMMFKKSREAVKGFVKKGTPAAVGAVRKYRSAGGAKGVIEKYHDAGGAKGVARKLSSTAKKARSDVGKHTKSLIG